MATNIAETSITISGVRYVIDSGFTKARAYSAKAGVDSLQVVPISQAQARQRSGRAGEPFLLVVYLTHDIVQCLLALTWLLLITGREGPGKAYRLYTEAAFASLPAATLPEIQRTNLTSVVLQLKAMGIEDVLGFDFMDPPPTAALLRAHELLCEVDIMLTDSSCQGVSDDPGTQTTLVCAGSHLVPWTRMASLHSLSAVRWRSCPSILCMPKSCCQQGRSAALPRPSL